jgi:hypothetical protein
MISHNCFTDSSNGFTGPAAGLNRCKIPLQSDRKMTVSNHIGLVNGARAVRAVRRYAQPIIGRMPVVNGA